MQLSSAGFHEAIMMNVRGDVMWADARVLDLEMSRSLSRCGNTLVLHFENVRTMASSTLGVLAGHIRKLPPSSRLLVVCPDPYVADLFEDSGLSRLLVGNIFTDLESMQQATGICVHPGCALPDAEFDTWGLQTSY